MFKVAFTIDCPTEEDTSSVARALAPLLSAGDVILLSGGIGSGKTHFARALIQSRLAKNDRQEDVPSPTFTIVQTYFDGECEIWHSDLYRLNAAEELIELGLFDAFETAVCLIEWPELLGQFAPDQSLSISISTNDQGGRTLAFSGSFKAWNDRLSGLVSV